MLINQWSVIVEDSWFFCLSELILPLIYWILKAWTDARFHGQLNGVDTCFSKHKKWITYQKWIWFYDRICFKSCMEYMEFARKILIYRSTCTCVFIFEQGSWEVFQENLQGLCRWGWAITPATGENITPFRDPEQGFCWSAVMIVTIHMISTYESWLSHDNPIQHDNPMLIPW